MTFDNHEMASRHLHYPLDEDLVIDAADNGDGAITKVTADFFPEDPDEKIDVVFNLSFNEFTAIASSVDIGRDIGYGTQSALIWWTWIRSLKGIGGEPVTCEDVADCLESEIEAGNQSLIDVLVQNSINTGTGGDVNRISGSITKFKDRNPPGSLENDPVLELLSCDLNALWGGIRYGLVERADDDMRNILESLAAISSVPDRLIEFLEAVPILGDIAQATLDLVTEAVPTLLTLFNSYSSLDHMDEYACGLFGLVCAECRYPTMREIYDYNKSFGIASMPEMAAAVFQAIVDAVVGSTESASLIAYFTLMNFRLGALLLQATFNGNTGTKAIIHDASLGEDFGNDNWLTLCDTCADDYTLWTWDFRTQGQGDFYQDTVQTGQQGVFEAGLGWRCVNFSTGRRFVVAFKFDPTWEVRAVAMLLTGDAGNSWQWVRRPTWGSTSGQSASTAGSANLPDWTRYWDGYVSLTGINEIYFFTQWTGQTAVAHLAQVSILFNTGHAPAGNSIQTSDITPYAP